MGINERIRALRTARKMRVKELAAACGVKPPSVSNWEGGRNDPSLEQLPTLARVLGTSVAYLLTGIESKDSVHFGYDLERTDVGSKRVPLLSYAQAGQLSGSGDSIQHGNATEWLVTNREVSAGAFALIVRGDAMSPDFRDGDTIIVDPAIAPIPGKYVIARHGDSEATFRKFRPRGVNEHGEQAFELVPLNPDYAPFYSDREPLQVLGVVIEHRRQL